MPDAVVSRILLDHDPVAGRDSHWSRKAHWPAHWISLPGEMPYVVGYRLFFSLADPTPIRFHVSADERYELYLDGNLVGRGPERGDVEHWAFESYEGVLPAGDHLFAARVWSLGAEAPYAQMTFGHGFLLSAEGAQLDTGTAPWEAAALPGHGTKEKGAAWGCGLKFESDGRTFPWGWEWGADHLEWGAPVVGDRGYARTGANDMEPGRMLVPAILPPQWSEPFTGGRVRHVADHGGGDTHAVVIRADASLPDEVTAWQALVEGRPLTVPAHTRRRVILDFEEYVCAYPEVRLLGGRDSTVRIHWQEALFDASNRKGNRDEIEGKAFRSFAWEDPAGRVMAAEDGVGDLFIAGGGDERHSTLWWEAGRYIEIVVETAGEPLTINGIRFIEDRYPLEDISEFASSDPRLAQVKRLAYRTLQMCAHETTMDCPFYEQLQYVGDTRLQCLVAYVTGDDDRLARQALLAFDRSRGDDGLTRSRYPSRIRQTIPTFSLWWVAMVHDFALWRGDLTFVADLMPGVRAVLDAYRRNVDDDGVYRSLDGWNFTDWVPTWADGLPSGADAGVSGILAFHLAFVARLASELETWMGEPELSARHARLADSVLAAAERQFWSAEHGLYADDPEHAHWSEHAQCLALLAGAAHGEDAVRRIADAANPVAGIARTTVYFDHYLFEAMGRIGRTDIVLERLGLWYDLLDSGLRTVVEMPEPTRSDCHAWGAHPVFHFVATLLGIRPTSPGMGTVRIAPNLGGLEWAESTIPTPHGPLQVRVDADGVHAHLPGGMTKD